MSLSSGGLSEVRIMNTEGYWNVVVFKWSFSLVLRFHCPQVVSHMWELCTLKDIEMLLSSGGPEAVKVSFFQFFQFVYICLRNNLHCRAYPKCGRLQNGLVAMASTLLVTVVSLKTPHVMTKLLPPILLFHFPPWFFFCFFILFFFTFHYWVTLDPFMAPAPALAKPR